jgi:hypothetical protein
MAKKKSMSNGPGVALATMPQTNTPVKAAKAGRSIPAFVVTTPQAGQVTNVKSTDGQTGVICACGVAVAEDGTPARAVWGKVYPTASVNPPATPPTDAVGTIPNQSAPNIGAWSLDQNNQKELPGAVCSSSAPYPANTLVLWFDWPGIGYQPYPVYFLGLASDHTDCS